MRPLIPLGIAAGTGLLNFLNQRSANKQAEKNQKRAASGQDYYMALDNTYSPWYGKGWSMGSPGKTGPSYLQQQMGALGQQQQQMGQPNPTNIQDLLQEMIKNRSMRSMGGMPGAR